MIYTKRRRALLSKAVTTYSGYLFVGLVVGQLVLLQERAFTKGLFVLGIISVAVCLLVAFFLESVEE